MPYRSLSFLHLAPPQPPQTINPFYGDMSSRVVTCRLPNIFPLAAEHGEDFGQTQLAQ